MVFLFIRSTGVWPCNQKVSMVTNTTVCSSTILLDDHKMNEVIMPSIGDPLRRNTFQGYSRHFWSSKPPKDYWNELAWVNRWYNPDDNRSIAPVQSHKFLEQPLPRLETLPHHWVAHPDIPLRALSRSSEEKTRQIISAPSLRCGQWSTLRQMLPFKGPYVPAKPPKWGTDRSQPPSRVGRRPPRRFGHTNSQMTNFVDDVHQTDKLFRLY